MTDGYFKLKIIFISKYICHIIHAVRYGAVVGYIWWRCGAGM